MYTHWRRCWGYGSIVRAGGWVLLLGNNYDLNVIAIASQPLCTHPLPHPPDSHPLGTPDPGWSQSGGSDITMKENWHLPNKDHNSFWCLPAWGRGWVERGLNVKFQYKTVPTLFLNNLALENLSVLISHCPYYSNQSVWCWLKLYMTQVLLQTKMLQVSIDRIDATCGRPSLRAKACVFLI